MTQYIINQLNGCRTYQVHKVLPSLNKEEMYHRPTVKYHLDIVAMDQLTIYHGHGQLKVLTIVDEYSSSCKAWKCSYDC